MLDITTKTDNRKKRERIPPSDPSLLTPEQVAKKIGYAKRTFLERIAPRPDFPPRISLTKRTFYWRDADVQAWLDRQRENRPKI